MGKTILMKWLLFLMAFLMVFGMFTACRNEDFPNATNTFTESESTTETGTLPVSADLVLAENKKTEYAVTYSSKADDSVAMAATAFLDDFKDMTGATPKILTETFSMTNEAFPNKEIIIGDSMREEFADFYQSLQYGEYAIAVRGEKILIGGNTTFAVLDALDYFCENILNSKTPSIAKDYFYRSDPTFSVKSIQIDDMDISEFRIIYSTEGTEARKVAANDLYRYIASSSGIELSVEKYSTSADLNNCIVIGETPVHSVTTESYGDYLVYAENGTIYVDGRDICGLASGVSYLANLLTASENVHLTSSTLNYSDSLQDRNTYLMDSSKFSVAYRYMNSPTAEELTLDYKIEQLNDPVGEVMLIAHRGEHTYYPENSLEATISAWRSGVSSVEVDIQQTKDGVWVCMHDETLSRTTNVASLKGTNGLPDSVNVSDWTLEELRQLNLLDSYGQLTPFLIPTVEEILVACDNKIFVHLDKIYNFVTDIFPLMEKTQVYECVYLVNNITYDEINRLNDYFQDKDVKLQNVLRVWSRYELITATDKITHVTSDLTRAIVPIGDYDKFTDADFSSVEKCVGKVRLGAWMLRENDIEYLWHEAMDRGFNILLTDYPFELIDYIRTH